MTSGAAPGCALEFKSSRDWGAYSFLHESNPAKQDWKSLSLYFGWLSGQVIQNTSRFGGTAPHHDYLK